MNLDIDLIYTFALLTILFMIALAYSVKIFIHGKSRYDRVDRQGGSVLLSKSLMEMAYWGLQPLGNLFIFLRISANGISFLSLIFGAIAGVSLAFGHFGSAGFFSALSGIFDVVDGLVARKTRTASDSGEVLDASIDRYVEFFFFVGLIIFYHEKISFLLLTLAALIGSFMVSYSTAKAEALQVSPPRGSMRRSERALYLTLGAMLTPIYPYAMIFALVIVAILSNISAVQRLYHIAQSTKIKVK